MVEHLIYKELSYKIVGAALEVHHLLGPGFLESVYSEALAHELRLQGLPHTREVPLEVHYKELLVGEYKADFVVDHKILLELKALAGLHVAHSAQVHNYLAATGLRLGLLLNFGREQLEFKRVVRSGTRDDPPSSS
jgi:GxxExxY protein